MNAHYVLKAETGYYNSSPDAFRLWAKHYYQCRLSFQYSDPFSPVPYFLLCRAIELQFKAVHLEVQRQAQVKKSFGHNLVKSYSALPAAYQTLSPEQFSLLDRANKIYSSKGFEYMNVGDALRGFSNFPDLQALDALTEALLGR
ncbi:MAG: hypothetical protein H7X91_10090 [Burkholderiales bacterium]|nr:hypothetical protein [Burkholderiales bacterium]